MPAHHPLGGPVRDRFDRLHAPDPDRALRRELRARDAHRQLDRLPHAQALSLIESTFVGTADHIAALEGPAFLAVLRRAAVMGTAGGRGAAGPLPARSRQARGPPSL